MTGHKLQPRVTEGQAAQRAAFARRINAMCDLYGIPAKYEGRQEVLARIAGVSLKAARRYTEGLGLPGAAAAARLAHYFRTSADELLNGDEPTTAPQQASRAVEIRLTDPERQLIAAMAQLQQVSFEDMAERLFHEALLAKSAAGRHQGDRRHRATIQRESPLTEDRRD